MSPTQSTLMKLRICFVAQNALGSLADGALPQTTGGVEWQQALMARWLAARGHDVSMITWDEGRGRQSTINGVRVVAFARRDAGLRGLRFIHPRWTGLYHALVRADADIYYYNLCDQLLGQLALWCRWHGRRYVYSVASDPACDARLPHLQTLRQRVLYRYGLRHADRVIVQTRRQREMLRENFGLEAKVLPMPCKDEGETVQGGPAPNPGVNLGVLWIGRFDQVKRLEWLLDLAERLPDRRFDVVGGPNEPSTYADAMVARARRIPNVVLHGMVPHSRVSDFYRRAGCLCCTSRYEGFPNTFLEAWSLGVPVISTVDPDDVLTQFGLGAIADDVDGLAREIRDLLESFPRRERVSSAARRYYLTNHALDPSMERFEGLFREVGEVGGRGR